MEVERKDPPRMFVVGEEHPIHLNHVADIRLEPDEQVTFTSDSGTEYDVVRKSWGYYATPSINRRLPAHGFRSALIVNESGSIYLTLVEQGRESDFDAYCREQAQRVVCWLDDDASLRRLIDATIDRG